MRYDCGPVLTNMGYGWCLWYARTGSSTLSLRSSSSSHSFVVPSTLNSLTTIPYLIARTYLPQPHPHPSRHATYILHQHRRYQNQNPFQSIKIQSYKQKFNIPVVVPCTLSPLLTISLVFPITRLFGSYIGKGLRVRILPWVLFRGEQDKLQLLSPFSFNLCFAFFCWFFFFPFENEIYEEKNAQSTSTSIQPQSQTVHTHTYKSFPLSSFELFFQLSVKFVVVFTVFFSSFTFFYLDSVFAFTNIKWKNNNGSILVWVSMIKYVHPSCWRHACFSYPQTATRFALLCGVQVQLYFDYPCPENKRRAPQETK